MNKFLVFILGMLLVGCGDMNRHTDQTSGELEIDCNQLDKMASELQHHEKYCESIHHYTLASQKCDFNTIREHQIAVLYSITGDAEKSLSVFRNLLKTLEMMGDETNLLGYKEEFAAINKFVNDSGYEEITRGRKCS